MEIGILDKHLHVEEGNKLVIDLSTYTNELPIPFGAKGKDFKKHFADNKDLIKEYMVKDFSNRLLNMVSTGDLKKDIDPINIGARVNTHVQSVAHSNSSIGTKFKLTLEHDNKEASPIEIIHTLRKDISEALADGFIDSILNSIPESQPLN